MPDKILQFTLYHKNEEVFQTNGIAFIRTDETFNNEKNCPSSVNPNKDSDFAEYRINIEGDGITKTKSKLTQQMNGFISILHPVLAIPISHQYHINALLTYFSFVSAIPMGIGICT